MNDENICTKEDVFYFLKIVIIVYFTVYFYFT